MTIIVNMINSGMYSVGSSMKVSILISALVLFVGGCNARQSEGDGSSQELLNVSYDPTRELWKALNEEFIADYQKKTGNDARDQAVARRLVEPGP